MKQPTLGIETEHEVKIDGELVLVARLEATIYVDVMSAVQKAGVRA